MEKHHWTACVSKHAQHFYKSASKYTWVLLLQAQNPSCINPLHDDVKFFQAKSLAKKKTAVDLSMVGPTNGYKISEIQAVLKALQEHSF